VRATRATEPHQPVRLTGNKPEFRAVPVEPEHRYPNIVLNLAVTESIDYTPPSSRGGEGRQVERRWPSCCRR
jgi:glutamine synthetase type III